MRNDDVTLIQRILSGDETAFASLVRKYQKQIHALAWRKIGDFHIAEDIMQEAFLQVYQKLETLEDPAKFPRWLYVIVDRLCIAWCRKNRLQTEPLEGPDTTDIETEAYSQFVAMQNAYTFAEARRDLVENLLAKLQESSRTAITLHYFKGMTYAEIGNFLGVSEGTIKSRIRRARQQLKKYEFMIQDPTIEEEHRSQEHLNGGFGMKLTFKRDDLLDSLQAMQGVANGRRTPPIISNVRIHAKGNTIECMATDTEIGIRMKVEGTIEAEGSIVVSTQKLEDIVKGLPSEKRINLATTADNRVEITYGDDICKIVELAETEFPQLPSVGKETFAIDGETLRSILYKTEFAPALKNESRYFLNGLYLEDSTKAAATIRKQLALAHCDPLKLSEDSDGFMVPLKTVEEIEQTFANSSEVRISRVENQMLFADEHATLIFRVGGKYFVEATLIIPGVNA